MELGTVAIWGAGALAASLAATLAALMALRRFGVLDRPNERSSHRRPVPRGGGIGFVLVIVVALAVLVAAGDAAATAAVIGGLLLVGAISFADDLFRLPWMVRLAVQAAAIGVALTALPTEPILAAGLPVILDRLLIGLAWLWFLNLFNFMDGIDGLAASEAALIGIGVVLLAAIAPDAGLAATEAAVIAGAALGFLAFNWPPAKLFMGDVGSASLGFILGWLLIDLAAKGYVAAALILPMVFVIDATTTVIARAIRRRPLWLAHRDHAYQAAVDRGLSHRAVVGLVVLADVAPIGLAAMADASPVLAVIAAAGLSVSLTAWLRWGRGGSRDAG